MKICLLTETFYPVTGGGETQARVLAAGLARRGAEVSLITRRSARELPRRERMEGFELYRLAPSGSGQLKKWGLVFTVFLTLLRLRRSCDVIVVCGYRIMGIPAVVVSRIFGKPCALKADSLGEFSGQFFRAGLARFRLSTDNVFMRAAISARNRLLRRAERFVAISSAVAKELEDGGIPRADIECIPNSVDTDRFSPANDETKRTLRSELDIGHQARVAVFTGRLTSTKGLPLLLRVWAGIADDYQDALLLVVGEGGLGLQNCEAELRRYVAEHRLEDSVRFVGSVENVSDYLRAADFFVFPTEREAFGISAIEAMACGLPLVTTDAGGLADIVEDGKTALVVEPGDGSSLDAAIRRVLEAGAGIAAMGVAARERAVSHYSEASVVTRYAVLLEDMVSGEQGV